MTSPVQEGLFWAKDGERLFYRFRAGAIDRSPILLLHGHGDHSGRFLKFFEQLRSLDSPVGIFDLRGCGLSSGTPVYVSSFDDYCDDVSCFLEFLRKHNHVTGRIRLFGHSLGGLIAAEWARRNEKEIEKLILSSPLMGTRLGPLTKVIITVLNRLFPRLIVNNPVYPPYLTHDRQEVEKYRTDPLIQRKITPRLAYEMLRYTTFFQKTETAFSFPVYILMAELDYVVDPKATRKFFERLRAPVKELEIFRGFFHDTFNELEQDKFFERLRYYLGR